MEILTSSDLPSRKTGSTSAVAWAVYSLSVLLGVGLCGLYIIADLRGSVYLSADHIWFQPIVYSYATTGALVHPFMNPITPETGGPVVWHGWLGPLVQGLVQRVLLPDGAVAQVKLSADGLALLAFVLCSGFFARLLGPWRAACLSPVLACLFLYQSGRPELVGSFFLLGYMGLLMRAGGQADRVSPVLVSCCVALIAVTSPTLAVYIILLHIYLLFAAETSRIQVWKIVGFCAVSTSVLVALLTVLVAGFSLGDWIGGLLLHAKRISSRSDGDFWDFYITGHLPYAAAFLFLGFVWWVKALANGQLRAEARVVLLVLAAFVYFSAVRVPPTLYNFVWLVPLLILLTIWQPPLRPDASLWRLGKLVLMGTVVVTYSLSAASLAVLMLGNLTYGQASGGVVAALKTLPARADVARDFYALPAQALTWSEDFIAEIKFSRGAKADNTHRVAFQAVTLGPEPEVKSGECLISHNYRSELRGIEGLFLYYAPLDWSYALIALTPCKDTTIPAN